MLSSSFSCIFCVSLYVQSIYVGCYNSDEVVSNPLIHGLNCVVCSTATNIACEDPFKADVSVPNSLSHSGFVSCTVSCDLHSFRCLRVVFALMIQKTVYWNGWGTYKGQVIIRSGSASACASSSSVGSLGTEYCCSETDNCNDASAPLVSIGVRFFLCLFIVYSIVMHIHPQ